MFCKYVMLTNDRGNLSILLVSVKNNKLVVNREGIIEM